MKKYFSFLEYEEKCRTDYEKKCHTTYETTYEKKCGVTYDYKVKQYYFCYFFAHFF